MSNTDIFNDVAVGDDEHKRSLQEEAGKRKCHLITKGVATLEKFYDLQEPFQV